MGKIKSNQNGFGAIAALLIVVVIIVIGLVGWLVYRNQHQTTPANAVAAAKTASTSSQTTTQSTKTYTDPGKLYSVSYPGTWTTTSSRINADSAIALADPNLSLLVPVNAPPTSTQSASPNGVDIIAFSTSDTQAALTQRTFGDNKPTPKSLTVNGYSALYQQDIAANPKQLPTYTDDQYAITHDGVTLVFEFREKQGSNAASSSFTFNVTSTVPAFTAIVQSVKFLN
jgi:hypothetical protein